MHEAPLIECSRNVPFEVTLPPQGDRGNNAVAEIDVQFTDPSGRTRRVPAFCAGDGTWKARLVCSAMGPHSYRMDSPDGETVGQITVEPYVGSNPLFVHGAVRIADDRRHFAHADGTPFLWLGDTWWMGLCRRMEWPAEFARLTEDRVAKGFNVVQIVAGLYPDMPAFDPRGENEAGFPWEADYAHLRPAYFDMADRRLSSLVDHGITPCIVGMWGYFLPWMGIEKAKHHWRNLIARYGAWPVMWCTAGEANLPYYLREGFPFDDREQVHGWTEVTRYLKATDPWDRPVSIHPTGLGRLTARGAIDDDSLLDFDMLQTGHGQRDSLAPSVDALTASLDQSPRMPVLNSEVNYEALLDTFPAEVVRLIFWPSLLLGAAGHTYGANGIWQCNRPDQAHGASPHGGNYGVISWEDAMNLPGSSQIAAAKRLLEELDWMHLTPANEQVSWDTRPDDPARFVPYFARVGTDTALAYVPDDRGIRVVGLRGAAGRITVFDPVSCAEIGTTPFEADAAGVVTLPKSGLGHDWVGILRFQGSE